ncbi:unnamed protein product [Periconia digitata]|uniref:Uncharacterized protein n=1 Tax=Periconia digitata TaxID=1303443 RepID=A0A9W4U4X0_9PLEO|nr:unnamed protein product [Periconia digitata]
MPDGLLAGCIVAHGPDSAVSPCLLARSVPRSRATTDCLLPCCTFISLHAVESMPNRRLHILAFQSWNRFGAARSVRVPRPESRTHPPLQTY